MGCRQFSRQLSLWICPCSHSLETHIIAVLFHHWKLGSHTRRKILQCKYTQISQSLVTVMVKSSDTWRAFLWDTFLIFTSPHHWSIPELFETLQHWRISWCWRGKNHGYFGHKWLANYQVYRVSNAQIAWYVNILIWRMDTLWAAVLTQTL